MLSILRSWYDSQAQSVVLGMSTTASLPLLVLPSASDGEATMVMVGVGDGATLVPVDQTSHEPSKHAYLWWRIYLLNHIESTMQTATYTHALHPHLIWNR